MVQGPVQKRLPDPHVWCTTATAAEAARGRCALSQQRSSALLSSRNTSYVGMTQYNGTLKSSIAFPIWYRTTYLPPLFAPDLVPIRALSRGSRWMSCASSVFIYKSRLAPSLSLAGHDRPQWDPFLLSRSTCGPLLPISNGPPSPPGLKTPADHVSKFSA